MSRSVWCEHLEKRSKFTIVDYRCGEDVTSLKVQSWFCPECGVHGAMTQIVEAVREADPVADMRMANAI
ncbi:MAG: hypothetical protein E6X17_10350 [Sporomusaceae bacterium]|nr:hypothetical protein [Sporomusaceae bacterium]